MAKSQKNHVVIHGVFISIFDIGVLITGDPGIGKSETALALITRGHQLIADDAVILKSSPLIGSCPELLQNFLEVKTLGILNIKKIFGEQAVKPSAQLQLIINLIADNSENHKNYIEVLKNKIPQVTITKSTARNREILIETAVRNFILQQQGYNANLDFANKQKKLLQQGGT